MQKTVILCIGNPRGGDDAVGPYIANKLKPYESDKLICLEAGIAPENFTGVVKSHQPDRLIIVDAIEMDLEPGKVRQVLPEKIGVMHVSTHGIPLSVLIKYFRRYVDNIILIGIQPSQMSGEMTEGVKLAGKSFIQRVLSNSVEKILKLT